MQKFDPPDPNFESRVRAGFAAQELMRTLGATLIKVAPGEVHIELPFSDALTQGNGFIHAGITTSIVDSACGYAAYSLMPADASVLTVEFKVNLINPAKGERFVAIGKVIKPGRTLSVCSGEVFAFDGGGTKLVALMQATMTQVAK
ncbi:MAG TPA: PaaI family thioesterase [Burkholderiales bacterium]|nr:PaaI family thioesterase [Burkholderiales bacterium]